MRRCPRVKVTPTPSPRATAPYSGAPLDPAYLALAGALGRAHGQGLDQQQQAERQEEAGGGHSHHDATHQLRSRAADPHPRPCPSPASLRPNSPAHNHPVQPPPALQLQPHKPVRTPVPPLATPSVTPQDSYPIAVPPSAPISLAHPPHLVPDLSSQAASLYPPHHCSVPRTPFGCHSAP